MSLKIVCVNAGSYLGRGYEYVCTLQKMVSRHLTLPHEFIVFTDDEADYPEPIIKRELPHEGLQGWWNKIALFKPDVFEEGDRILYLDLDTLIVANIDAIASYGGDHAMVGQFFAKVMPPFDGPQSSVMAWQAECCDHIWHVYHITGYPQNIAGGDQKFISRLSPNVDIFQDLFPGQIVSYKASGGELPEAASIVCFHGLPRPHEVTEGWVPSIWGGASV